MWLVVISLRNSNYIVLKNCRKKIMWIETWVIFILLFNTKFFAFVTFFNLVSDGLDMRPKYSGIIHCMKSVWKQEGMRGLYQGVTPNIWGAGASWGLYFLLYVGCKATGIIIYMQWKHFFTHLSSIPATTQSKATLKRVDRPSWVPPSTWFLQLKQVSFIPTLPGSHLIS